MYLICTCIMYLAECHKLIAKNCLLIIYCQVPEICCLLGSSKPLAYCGVCGDPFQRSSLCHLHMLALVPSSAYCRKPCLIGGNCAWYPFQYDSNSRCVGTMLSRNAVELNFYKCSKERSNAEHFAVFSVITCRWMYAIALECYLLFWC